MAIYYRQDGEQIPNPGIIVIGRIDSGVEAFDVPGSVRLTFEALVDERRAIKTLVPPGAREGER